jgi:hypothetical protein
MAYAGQQSQGDVEKAFGSAVQALELSGLSLLAKNEISLSRLDLALKKLARLKPLAKPRLLEACVASVVHDQRVSPVEVELLRAFSDVLDCPMPPVA